VDLEGVFVQIGLVPNTDWLKGTVELSKHGEIVVDAKGQTSVPGVFAAGDATTTPFKQIIIAAGDGAKAALGAFDHSDPQRRARMKVKTPTMAPSKPLPGAHHER
jgi:alkyl hydroperoxide reductase subunit F